MKTIYVIICQVVYLHCIWAAEVLGPCQLEQEALDADLVVAGIVDSVYTTFIKSVHDSSDTAKGGYVWAYDVHDAEYYIIPETVIKGCVPGNRLVFRKEYATAGAYIRSPEIVDSSKWKPISIERTRFGGNAIRQLHKGNQYIIKFDRRGGVWVSTRIEWFSQKQVERYLWIVENGIDCFRQYEEE